MTNPPTTLSGLVVRRVLTVDSTCIQLPTATREIAGAHFDRPEYMAICRDPEGVFLFYCRADWSIWNDLYFASEQDAVEFVEHEEYAGTSTKWQSVP